MAALLFVDIFATNAVDFAVFHVVVGVMTNTTAVSATATGTVTSVTAIAVNVIATIDVFDITYKIGEERIGNTCNEKIIHTHYSKKVII